MGSVRHPRGRLPRRVYWVRRCVVLGLALVLVFGIGKLLGGTGADPADSDLEASTSSAQQSEQPSEAASLAPVAPSATAKGQDKVKTPLAAPAGECRADEVSVLPSVPRPWGAQPITIRLGLSSLQPACTFHVSPETVAVKITSGSDRIWSSQDCPEAIPTTDVVARSETPTYVNIVWSGRRSDESCSRHAAWADKGYYHAFAAALGSTPTDVQFEVVRAPTAVVTRTTKPKPSKKATATPNPAATQSTTVSGKQSKCGGDNAASSC